MRQYPSSASTAVRLKFGRRMTRRLRSFAQSEPLADVLQVSQQALRDAEHATSRLEELAEEASDNAAIGEYKAEQKVRRAFSVAKEKDGDREGTVTSTLFPKGLTPIIVPKGQSQIKAIDELIHRATESKIPEVVAARAEILPIIQEARELVARPYETYVAATRACSEAEAIEKLRAGEHRRSIDSLFGQIRALFPGDRAFQELLVPPLPSVPKTKNDDDETDDDETNETNDKEDTSTNNDTAP